MASIKLFSIPDGLDTAWHSNDEKIAKLVVGPLQVQVAKVAAGLR